MVLVVSVEDNLLIGGKLGSNGLPEGLEIGGRGDNVTMVSSVVVGVKDGIGAAGGDELDSL